MDGGFTVLAAGAPAEAGTPNEVGVGGGTLEEDGVWVWTVGFAGTTLAEGPVASEAGESGVALCLPPQSKFVAGSCEVSGVEAAAVVVGAGDTEAVGRRTFA